MIIAFSGLAGAGKTTAAKYLIDRYDFKRVRFADPLKAMLRELIKADGDVERWIEGDLKETIHPTLGCTPRKAMQTLGTEWGREQIRDDLWVYIAGQRVAQLAMLDIDVVIDDLRFPNEADLVKQLGGINYRVTRQIDTSGRDLFNHPSEAGCRFDKVLLNTGDIADLEHQLDAIITASR